MKKLFLSYYSGSAEELVCLAAELRLRGIVPWVDKQGGLLVGDDAEATARRAIREECFGLALYATDEAFRRPFIRDVEMDEATKARAADPSFLLFAIARGIAFEQVRRCGEAEFGVDLSRYHGLTIPDGSDIHTASSKVAGEVLSTVLRRAYAKGVDHDLYLQFSNLDAMPDGEHDVLRIDARELLSREPDQTAWDRVLRGLVDVKEAIAANWGRPHVHVHGSTNLPAAFLFGRAFSRFAVSVRQSPTEVWRTDAPIGRAEAPLLARVVPGAGSRTLSFEISIGRRDVTAGVADLIRSGAFSPSTRLQLGPAVAPLHVDEAIARCVTAQARDALDEALRRHPTDAIHLFAAVPKSVMMMLGRELTAAPPVHLYEWDGASYRHCCVVPGGRL